MLLLSPADLFFKNTYFKKIFQEHLIRVSNSLGPDQDRQNVGPDCEPNCLQRSSADNISHCRDLTNSKFGFFLLQLFDSESNFFKSANKKYGKTPNFSGKQHFTPIFKILVRTLHW